GITSIPNLSHGAIIYVGSGNGKLYALKASDGLAESAWPASRRASLQRARATGSVVRRQNSLTVKATGAGSELSATLEPGRSYRLETSPDLQNWTTITNLASPSGVAQFRDVLAGGSGLRFYRLASA